ncbi:unnamed protein product [Pleuronectes platessa]|uniref:Uncharacterized protein n=1 Tax=Pleuronectes platessa TaxID=8262 RepID=A0A9N7UXA4_PLEPL|nr:unnamed protein product [Pleuronectes platessa]
MTGDTAAFPRGKKKQEEGGAQHHLFPPTSSNGWGSINSSGGNNNPNKPRQRVGHLSELLIDHSLLETSYSSLPLCDMWVSGERRGLGSRVSSRYQSSLNKCADPGQAC